MTFYLFFNFFLFFTFCFQLKNIHSNYSEKWKDRLPYYKLKLNSDSKPTNCNRQNSSVFWNKIVPVPGGVNIKTTKPFYPNLKSNFVFHPPISSKSSFPSKYSSYSSHHLSPPYNQRQKHNLPSLKNLGGHYFIQHFLLHLHYLNLLGQKKEQNILLLH
uniref:Uncharacterized protein n=1 Tax=Meloidogyne enterolobii TaxID=390850 RepID=A0A6V7TVH1_MELEN|nr:unnamed protein product [Meloidogyne enterolobii]